MRPSLQQRVEQDNDKGIDLSPLLDVVFIMLIFFIVTTVFVNETGIEVDKPQAVTTTDLERTVIMIAIADTGEVVYDGANIGAVGVRATVAQLLRTQPDRPVVVQADKKVPTGLLVQVIDEAKLAGAIAVNIATAY
jgi:biopolymer transport protein ExbD